jgi:hypothetical protein
VTPVATHLAPGHVGAVDGHDRGDLDVSDAEDLVLLVGLPADPVQGQGRAGGGRATAAPPGGAAATRQVLLAAQFVTDLAEGAGRLLRR